MKKRQPGFTLIELMITVVMIAILASIAFPSYQSYLRRSNRGSAQAFMMEVAQREQARFLDTRSYVEVDDNDDFSGALNISPPAEVSTRYEIDVNIAVCTPDPNPPPPCFRITAVAKGSQLDDKNLVLTSSGTKTRDGQASKW